MQCFFGIFRSFRRLTRRNSELDKKLFELGQKSGELNLDFYLESSLTDVVEFDRVETVLLTTQLTISSVKVRHHLCI